jgi:glycosyltransferase involved in cell wall biosynthesis
MTEPHTYHSGEITAVIPVHLPNLNNGMYYRAMASVSAQSRAVDQISVALDRFHDGAAATRDRALSGITTEWTAFLDSDDQWYPDHIASLVVTALTTKADVVYPWFDVPEGFDPFPQYEGQPFNEEVMRETRNYVPITVLAKTELLHRVGGFAANAKGPKTNPCEDWGMWLALLDVGAKFVHHNGRTWRWNWHKSNTSGSGENW